jgi:Xaa-Pro aminopeptidase
MATQSRGHGTQPFTTDGPLRDRFNLTHDPNVTMPDPAVDRAADLLAKHERVSALLREADRDGLLVLDPANFAWLTTGATAKGVASPADLPCLFVQNSYRWILCSNVDTQRLFDEELDGLGFQLKEWPWHLGRTQLLADLVHGKKVACDGPFNGCTNVSAQMAVARLTLSDAEQTRLLRLGKSVAHALEATGRNLDRGDSEEEIAGQLSHRLLHHGFEPVTLFVAADDRGRRYRRGGATKATVERTCTLQVTARKWGLHATASRTVAFGPVDDVTRQDHELACKTTAIEILSSTPHAKPADILALAGRLLQTVGLEHEWRLAPAGWLTGFAPAEYPFTPTDATTELAPGQAVVWTGNIAGATNADTILITDAGPQVVTPPEGWPVKRIKLAGVPVDRPDVLVRPE